MSGWFQANAVGYILPKEERLVLVSATIFKDLLERSTKTVEPPAGSPAGWLEALLARLEDGECAVRAYRQLRGLSLADLAARVGISRAHMREIDAGNTDGSLSVRRRIAEVLDVTLDDLEPWPSA